MFLEVQNNAMEYKMSTGLKRSTVHEKGVRVVTLLLGEFVSLLTKTFIYSLTFFAPIL